MSLNRPLRLRVAIMLLLLGQPWPIAAQTPEKESKPVETKPASETSSPKEESSATDHVIRIGDQTIPYKATAATMLLKDSNGEPAASLFSIAYTRSDVKDLSQRPLAFLYNGGPGSSSVWLHMGAFGPKRVITADPQATPPPPYRMADNASCLLDKADLVFIDPVGTGFSRAVGKAKEKDFWGIDQDVKSLSQFVVSYVSRNRRWNSPKILIGESYGTFRSAALVSYLQSNESMDFNGVVMISAVLDLGLLSFNPGDDLPYILYLPSYAATAWYHKLLKEPPSDLNAFMVEARRFATTEYAGALMKGSTLTATEKSETAKKLTRYTGLSEDYLLKANLRVKLSQFRKELQRSRELTTGRLDARFSGPSVNLLGESAESDPQSNAVSGAFTAAFNQYVREELKFGGDRSYTISNREANRNWEWKRETVRARPGLPGSPNVEPDLVDALTSNVHLLVQIENGIYDLATPFFQVEHTVTHLDLPEKIRNRIRLNYYDAGHMMYLREEDLAKLKSNVASFIDKASKPKLAAFGEDDRFRTF